MVKFGELAAHWTSDGQNRHMTQEPLFIHFLVQHRWRGLVKRRPWGQLRHFRIKFANRRYCRSSGAD